MHMTNGPVINAGDRRSCLTDLDLDGPEELQVVVVAQHLPAACDHNEHLQCQLSWMKQKIMRQLTAWD